MHNIGLLNKLHQFIKRKTILNETYYSIHLKHNIEKPIISAQWTMNLEGMFHTWDQYFALNSQSLVIQVHHNKINIQQKVISELVYIIAPHFVHLNSGRNVL